MPPPASSPSRGAPLSIPLQSVLKSVASTTLSGVMITVSTKCLTGPDIHAQRARFRTLVENTFFTVAHDTSSGSSLSVRDKILSEGLRFMGHIQARSSLVLRYQVLSPMAQAFLAHLTDTPSSVFNLIANDDFTTAQAVWVGRKTNHHRLLHITTASMDTLTAIDLPSLCATLDSSREGLECSSVNHWTDGNRVSHRTKFHCIFTTSNPNLIPSEITFTDTNGTSISIGTLGLMPPPNKVVGPLQTDVLKAAGATWAASRDKASTPPTNTLSNKPQIQQNKVVAVHAANPTSSPKQHNPKPTSTPKPRNGSETFSKTAETALAEKTALLEARKAKSKQTQVAPALVTAVGNEADETPVLDASKAVQATDKGARKSNEPDPMQCDEDELGEDTSGAVVDKGTEGETTAVPATTPTASVVPKTKAAAPVTRSSTIKRLKVTSDPVSPSDAPDVEMEDTEVAATEGEHLVTTAVTTDDTTPVPGASPGAHTTPQ